MFKKPFPLEKNIYSREMVLGLVICGWSMRKEVGKNNKVKQSFLSAWLESVPQSQKASPFIDVFIQTCSEIQGWKF